MQQSAKKSAKIRIKSKDFIICHLQNRLPHSPSTYTAKLSAIDLAAIWQGNYGASTWNAKAADSAIVAGLPATKEVFVAGAARERIGAGLAMQAVRAVAVIDPTRQVVFC
ncbi:hypothetical protein GCM10023165_39640 [Variovorax defluvii]|uniref:Uncharacterized protein n=1 Tax=Variovorax defluvii TaxID=913761 RepID=A0ABP8I4U8_9BURK